MKPGDLVIAQIRYVRSHPEHMVLLARPPKPGDVHYWCLESWTDNHCGYSMEYLLTQTRPIALQAGVRLVTEDPEDYQMLSPQFLRGKLWETQSARPLRDYLGWQEHAALYPYEEPTL